MKSLLSGLLLVCCASPSTTVSRNEAAKSPTVPNGSPPIAESTGTDSAKPIERAELVDVISAPERYLDRTIVVRGTTGVCPDPCDGIKFRCGTVSPSSGPCSGYVAFALDEPSSVEVQCAATADKPQNALAVGVDDTKAICRGHCGQWACPTVELGRHYEATGRLHSFLDADGRTRYTLAPESIRALVAADAGR